TPSTAVDLPEMPKRQLADRILDEILAMRRPRSVIVELDNGRPSEQDRVLNDSQFAAATRRQVVVE
ncbi:MAG: hypothetical protein ACLGP3_09195, partial [Acidobacteriota bacterium]